MDDERGRGVWFGIEWWLVGDLQRDNLDEVNVHEVVHSSGTWWSPEYLIVWRHINDGPGTIYNTGTVLLSPGNHGLSVGKISIVSQNINHTIVIQPPTPALPQAAAGVTKLVQ